MGDIYFGQVFLDIGSITHSSILWMPFCLILGWWSNFKVQYVATNTGGGIRNRRVSDGNAFIQCAVVC
jgi:hypothetical protein